MTHFTEDSRPLDIIPFFPQRSDDVRDVVQGCDEVIFLRLPAQSGDWHNDLRRAISEVAAHMGQKALLLICGEITDLVQAHSLIAARLHYHLWIAVRSAEPRCAPDQTALPQQHFGILVYSAYPGQLRHARTRLHYTFCPACDKTTKDYGGKKHTYHPVGTLISDVWRDMQIDLQRDLAPLLTRIADLFGVEPHRQVRVCDLAAFARSPLVTDPAAIASPRPTAPRLASALLHGDVLVHLAALPDEAVDFAFADPPYNLKKAYRGYADDLDVSAYFAWCDAWISEVARVLRPGATFALLNIPLWAIRHFQHMQTVLTFQNWIVWDALSFPVRQIMPAHYAILCFTKGAARPLPGLVASQSHWQDTPSAAWRALEPLADGFCVREACLTRRQQQCIDDRAPLTDLWSDVHRLKHNARRVDHPCQLPPLLLYRLIQTFTHRDELVLDPFNGAGTTTLAAHQLHRRYIGIELEARYHQMALERHAEVEQGIDPFRKAQRDLTAKNSPVARMKKQKYAVPKKTLQLEVRRVAQMLGRLPSRAEMIEHGQYPIRYYDEYFAGWGEVCAAARNAGMRETRDEPTYPDSSWSQKRLF